jgi:DNA modification methylase
MNLINDNFGLKNSGFSNSENTIDLARHRWYYYKEGFSPLLVENAIEQVGLNKNDLILDPFNGSGTTTLTAASKGYKSLGIEVNPFTAFLSNAKVKNVDITGLKDATETLLDPSYNAKSNLLGFSTFSKKETINKWLFNDDVLNAFESTWQQTNLFKSPELKQISQLALITSAMQNCNARRDGKCLRYRPEWPTNNYDGSSFSSALKINLERIEEDITSHPISTFPKIINGDCRKVLADLGPDQKFKLCITSPPYLNTFDYTDIYRPELFLGKFVNTAQELYNLRLTTVRSHVQAKWEDPKLSDFGSLYEKSINHVNNNQENLMHKYIPKMIQAYFEDMYNILTLLRNKADKGAQLWFVVSNSAYAGMEIPVDLIIGDIGTKAGWYLREIGVLRYLNKRQTKYSKNVKELRESVIILSAQK